jgi:hypothetical protein
VRTAGHHDQRQAGACHRDLARSGGRETGERGGQPGGAGQEHHAIVGRFRQGRKIRLGLRVRDEDPATGLAEAHEPGRDRVTATTYGCERYRSHRPHTAGRHEPEHARARGRKRRIPSHRRVFGEPAVDADLSVDDHPLLGGERGRQERHRQPRAVEHSVDLGSDAAAERGIELLVEDAAGPGPERAAGQTCTRARLGGRSLSTLGVDDEDGRARVRQRRRTLPVVNDDQGIEPARGERGPRVAGAREVVRLNADHHGATLALAPERVKASAAQLNVSARARALLREVGQPAWRCIAVRRAIPAA